MGLVVLPPVLLLARVPMARREAAIGATTATIVTPWKNPEFVPRTGRHVAAYMCIYHVRMGCTSQTTLITACHSVAPGSGKPFLVYQLTGGPLEHDCYTPWKIKYPREIGRHESGESGIGIKKMHKI